MLLNLIEFNFNKPLTRFKKLEREKVRSLLPRNLSRQSTVCYVHGEIKEERSERVNRA